MTNRLPVFLALLCAAAAAEKVNAKPHVRFGGLVIGAGYSYGTFPYWGWSPFYYSDPWLWGFSPAFYPGYFGGFPYGPYRGEVKIQNASHLGAVYINGGYAGEAPKLKSMWLDPGVYDLEIRTPGEPAYQRRIYVLTGKTLKFRAQGKP